MAITNTAEAYDKEGNMYLKCTIDDGSVWTCDIDGTNWVQIRPTTVALESSFSEK